MRGAPLGTATAKPARGTALLAKRETQAARKKHERTVMDQARRRDRGCRWPGCECRVKKLPIAVAHERHRSMGGNPSGDRTTTDTLISLCVVRHGDWDRGDIAIVPQDRVIGFDGPADFYRRTEGGQLEFVAGRKRTIGVSATRSAR